MKAAFFGFGSIAKRHLANLRAALPECEVLAFRRNAERVEGVDVVATTWEEVESFAPNIAFVTSPSSCHIEQASRLPKMGVDTIIEKPLANSLRGTEGLLETASSSDVVAMLAYQFRFYDPFLRLRELLSAGAIGTLQSVRIETGMYLPDWRPHLDYRDAVSARKDLGGGVLLELSHELDYLQWLFGRPTRVSALVGRQSDLEIDVEDSAEAIMELSSGAFASVHIDMTQRVPYRGLRACGSKGSIEWNWGTHEVRLWNTESSEWRTETFADTARNSMYENQLAHFLDCVRSRRTPDVGIEDGIRALALVQAIAESSETKEWISL